MSLTIEDLKSSNLFLHAVLENVQSAIMVVDRQMAVQALNRSLLQMFMIEEVQTVNRLCGNALGCENAVREHRLCGETSQCGFCEIRQAFAKTFCEHVPTDRAPLRRSFQIDGELVAKDLLFTTRYIDYQGEELVLVILEDVTELEGQRRRLEELNELKNRFLGMAAHDLRNPAGVLKGYLALFTRGTLGPVSETQLTILERMRLIVESELKLVNDLLDINAIESGRIDLHPRPVELASYLGECREHWELIAHDKDIRLELTFECPAAELPPLTFDPDRIGQVLGNLISNAIKFSFPQSTVHLGVRRVTDAVELWVTDEGQGIPADELNQLFHDFGRTSVRPTAGERSTGLGLAIVRRIVEAHQGQIRVESKLGAGSTFLITLPLDPAPQDNRPALV